MNTVIAAGVALQPKYVVDTPKGVVDSKNLFESKLHVGFIFIKKTPKKPNNISHCEDDVLFTSSI